MSEKPKDFTQSEWKQRLDRELEKDHKARIYSLATIENREVSPEIGARISQSPLTSGMQTDYQQAMIPRVRSIVHRSFLTLEHAKQESGACVLQATTDIRSAKGTQIHNNNNAAEVLWWFPESQVQFRLQTRAFLLPAISHEWRKDFPTDLAGKDTAKVSVDWEAVRVECFNQLSSFLRASFARPPPGSALCEPEKTKEWPNELPKLGDGTDDKEKELLKYAFDNFAVLYLEVEEVDVVDLGIVPNEHYRYTLDGTHWSKRTLVP